MRRTLALLLTLAMFVSLMAAGGIQAFADDVSMKYMTADETEAVLGTDGYTIVDLRKAADYEEAHIPGAISVDMSAAVEGDTAAGEAAMAKAAAGLDDTLILVCYSGKKYAQAGTNALAALGYDMEKVFTLKDGFNGWAENKADLTESGAPSAVTGRTVYVTPEWLSSALAGNEAGYENAVVICVAYPGSTDVYTAYGEGHIPGAIYASIMEVEDATGSEEGAYNLLAAEEVRDYLLGHGITADTKVVLYGPDVCGVARQAYGYIWCGVKDVKILNGGLEAWTAAGFPTETEGNALEAASDFGCAVPAHPEYWVSLEEARNRPSSDENFKLVSIRTEGEWLGETSGYGYMDKAGEPEGAVWGRGGQTAADVLDFCTVEGDAILVNDLDALKAVWADCDFTLDNFLAFYCGTGWRACVPFLVLYENGYDNIAVFDGGWYEILFHDDFPVQVGDPASDACVHTTVGELETGKAAA